jgi:hypothetical protein
MLREIVNKHVKPRIVPFQLTTTASTATMNIGYGDYTVTRTGTGAGALVHRHGFYRNGLILLSQGTTNGGYAVYNTTAGENDNFLYSILDNAGAAAEGTAEGFCFGWDSSDLSLCKKQRVAATLNAPRIIWGKITGTTGATAIGIRDFSATRTAAGTYTVTFKKAFAFTPVVMVTGIATAAATTARITSKTAAGCTVLLAPQTGTATDADFYICAIGSDARSDAGRGRMPLQNSQRLPRIIACEITNTGGTPTLTIGGSTGGTDFTTLTDNGAGDFSITVAEPFKREPAIFITTTTQRAQVHSYAANVIRLQTRASGGAATDTNGVTHVFVIGTDDISEY